MKWLIILLILLVVVLLIAYRYRKQIQTAWLMYRTFSKMRKQMRPPAKEVEPKSRAADSELVRCPKCNKWVPMDDAVKLKANYYCSLACLEESITLNR